MSGEAGVWASPVRCAMRAAEAAYRSIIERRNRSFDRSGASVRAPVPVISVGNLTVGGTGKTPFVIELVSRLEGQGANAAILLRGYGAAPGEANDEERLIRRRCRGVVCVADADRVRGAERAVRRFGSDVLILDDGFQHRRLARDLDIVLVDAICPFGYGHLLPRGLLREPATSLRRADLVVVTRSDQVSEQARGELLTQLARLAPDTMILQCRSRVVQVSRPDGSPRDSISPGSRVVLFAGIGQPQAFLTTVRSLGFDVVGTRWWTDHHRYRRRNVESLFAPGRFPPFDVALTTEKDAVKVERLGDWSHRPIAVVQVAVDFVGEGDTMLASALRRVVPARSVAGSRSWSPCETP